MATAPNVIVKTNFKLADRIKIQQQTIRDKNYIVVGRLTSIVFEAQRSTAGLSQSHARWNNAKQASELANQPGLHPFSERQAVLWAGITLDWLTHKDAPILAISRDQQDLLLPFGLTALPPIPDPRWVPRHARQACPKSLKHGCKGCVTQRISQKLVGCPVVGDRVRDMIKDREGRTYGVIHPLKEMCLMLGGAQGGFGKIRGGANAIDGTHLSLLIDDSDPEHLEGYFLGGRFQLGG
jgi:hypothetical protein